MIGVEEYLHWSKFDANRIMIIHGTKKCTSYIDVIMHHDNVYAYNLL